MRHLRFGDLILTKARSIPVARDPWLPGNERSIQPGNFVLVLGPYERRNPDGSPMITDYVRVLTARGLMVAQRGHLEADIKYEGWGKIVIATWDP